MPFHIFRHWIANMKKKTSVPLDQVIKKSCDTVQQKWKQASWAPQIHNQYHQSQAQDSPWSHFLCQFIVCYYEAPEKAENHPQSGPSPWRSSRRGQKPEGGSKTRRGATFLKYSIGCIQWQCTARDDRCFSTNTTLLNH